MLGIESVVNMDSTGFTNIAAGLEYAHDALRGPNSRAGQVPQVMVLMTDGTQSDQHGGSSVVAAADVVKRMLYAIGFDNADAILGQIASHRQAAMLFATCRCRI